MKRRFGVAALALTMTLSFAACGGGDEGATMDEGMGGGMDATTDAGGMTTDTGMGGMGTGMGADTTGMGTTGTTGDTTGTGGH